MKRKSFIQNTSTGTDNQNSIVESMDSKCMYCGSTYYGSGCIYSSHGTHVHTGNDGKCIYCGSLYYGSGCIFNPYNNMHVHGSDVGISIRETTRKTLEMSYIFERLLVDIKETTAFKLNLINADGKQIRTPNNLYETYLVSPLSKAIYKIRKFLPKDTYTIKEAYRYLDTSTSEVSESIETFEKEVEFTQDIKYVVQMLTDTLKKYGDTLPPEKIEKIIEDTILESI